MNSPDQELLQRILDRDPEAFRELMERFAGPVTNIAFRFLGNRADAEETAQDLFLRLYERPPWLAPSAKLFTWIYRVTVNLCLDRLRRRKRTPATLSLDMPLSGEEPQEPLAERLAHPRVAHPREQAAGLELTAALRRAVAGLPEPLRVPLLLAATDELSHESIGEILRLSPKAVERRVSRARALLKVCLQPYL